MPNIIDYLNWRGDLNFNQDPINEVDSIIFGNVGYFDV